MNRLVMPRTTASWSRRDWLAKTGAGFGMVGLAGLLASEQTSPLDAAEANVDRTRNPLAAKPGHFPAKAKHVIWIFINGGPSHVDTWDYKPELTKWAGKSMEEFDKSFDNTTFF